MDLGKYLNSKDDLNKLKRFAFLGDRSSFDKKLNYLTQLAEPENWFFTNQSGEQLSVIFYYVVHTFDRCFYQEKIEILPDETMACFNTGLMTQQGEEIFGMFTKSNTHNPTNPSSNYWYLSEFLKESDRKFIRTGLNKPQMATYFTNYNELYFDPTKEISLSFDHIYDDNYDRLPRDFKLLEKNVAIQVFKGFLEHTIKRIKRNNRIPVPQFYREKVMFLIPVQTFQNDLIVIALEKVEGKYIANTILTIEMAYNCARLLNKPESNWLLPKSK